MPPCHHSLRGLVTSLSKPESRYAVLWTKHRRYLLSALDAYNGNSQCPYARSPFLILLLCPQELAPVRVDDVGVMTP